MPRRLALMSVLIPAVLACTPAPPTRESVCLRPTTSIDLPVDDIPSGRDLYQPTSERFCADFARGRRLSRCYRVAGEYALTCEWSSYERNRIRDMY